MTFLYNTSLRFSGVCVLESLPAGALKTGTALYDDVVFPHTRRHEGMHASLVSAPDRQAFLRALDQIGERAIEQRRSPVVHIEAHGAAEGIELADGSVLLWTEIVPKLVRINTACRMNLLVVAMSCEGWSLTGSLMPADRAPAFAVVGPTRAISAADIDAATRQFYTTLLSAFMLDDALMAMNGGAEFDSWRFKPGTAEILFCRVFREYVKELGAAAELRSRENEVVASSAARQGLDVLQTAMLRSEIRPHLGDHRWWYEHFRRTFLMLDLFPEHAERFGLSYELCMDRARTSTSAA